MMKAITAAFTVKYLLGMQSGGSEGVNSLALQQGGIGLLLSTLIIMATPMAAAFFQGTLGQFASYSSFGTIGSQISAMDQQAAAQGRTPARSYNPPPSNTENPGGSTGQTNAGAFNNYGSGVGSQPQADVTKTKQIPGRADT